MRFRLISRPRILDELRIGLAWRSVVLIQPQLVGDP